MIRKESLAASKDEGPLFPKPNPLSLLTFWWVTDLVVRTYRQKELNMKDLWLLSRRTATEHVWRRWNVGWEAQKASPKPSIAGALWRMNWKWFLWASVLFNAYQVLLFVPVQLITRLVDVVVDPEVETWRGYMYCAIITGAALIGSHCLYHALQISNIMGVEYKTALMQAIYTKVFVLSNKSRNQSTVGEIVNLMSNDANTFQELFMFILYGVYAVVQITICQVLLYLQLGPYSFIGLGLIVFTTPINGWLSKNMTTARQKTLKFTDNRVKMTNQIIQSIRSIKFYGWEESFVRIVLNLRDAEMEYISSFIYWRAVVVFSLTLIPVAVAAVTFAIYVAAGEELTPSKIFTSLSLFALMRVPAAFLPYVLAVLAQAIVGLRRISRFLLLEEMPRTTTKFDPSQGKLIRVKNCDFSWDVAPPTTNTTPSSPAASSPQDEPNQENGDVELKQQPFKLTGIDFEVPEGALCMVVGSVGSGKTTLVHSLLGEINPVNPDGQVLVNGTVAYVGQQPTILNATLRENILFGLPYDDIKYKEAVRVSALEPDLNQLRDGDETEIGERGLNLSGGQKQRVSIARAVYSDRNIYIFDDPLSAVDVHVGKHIFEQCIKKALANKTRFLVTNQLQYLPAADEIIVLRAGTIAEKGNYKRLMEDGKCFSELIQEFGSMGTGNEYSHEEETVVETPKVASPEKENTIAVVKPASSEAAAKAPETLVSSEEKDQGEITWAVWKSYLVAGGLSWCTLTTISVVLAMFCRGGSDYWLALMTDNAGEINDKLMYWLGIYVIWGIGLAVFTLSMSLLSAKFSIVSSLGMHKSLLMAVIKSPMSFFDSTPAGRILNRFSKDMLIIDTFLMGTLSQYLNSIGQVLCVLTVIIVVQYYLLIVFGPLLIIYVFLQHFYKPTPREIQRLESVSRSPIFVHLSETLGGVATIRAYGLVDMFINSNVRKLDTNNRANLALICVGNWLSLRLEWISAAVTLATCLAVVIFKDSFDAGMVGLIISYSLNVAVALNFATKSGADSEAKMNTVERIEEYTNLKIEEPVTPAHVKDWPSAGNIRFEDTVMTYRPGLKPALDGVSFTINAGEKVGIVGRTGSGKSSLMLCLFRLVPLESGKIFIDGVDIATVPLQQLRSSLGIIPQDPTMFAGTIKSNLDPFNEYSDDKLWDVLAQVNLKPYVQSLDLKLEAPVAESGENFSVGQRQLICLARTLLRKPKVLVMDEATASVDIETDALIQKKVREQFKDSTVLSIAHRINTILDSDKILVMDNGHVGEYASPKTMLADPNSMFSRLVNEMHSQQKNVSQME